MTAPATISESQTTLPPRMITVATNNSDMPIVLFLWHSIDQLRAVLDYNDVRANRSVEFDKSFPNTYTFLTNRGVFYVMVKCGAFDEFASFDSIRTTLDGLEILSEYRLGETMYRIKRAMEEYAHQHLDEDIARSIEYATACDSSRNDGVLSHSAHLQISDMHKHLIHCFYGDE